MFLSVFVNGYLWCIKRENQGMDHFSDTVCVSECNMGLILNLFWTLTSPDVIQRSCVRRVNKICSNKESKIQTQVLLNSDINMDHTISAQNIKTKCDVNSNINRQHETVPLHEIVI